MPLEQQPAPGSMRKAARAGAADKKIENRLSAAMDQLLRFAAKQDWWPAYCSVGGLRAGIIARRSEFRVSLADESMRALGRFDVALACQTIKREQNRIARDAEMVGQLPGTWNIAAGAQLLFRYELSDLVADLFVKRAVAAGFNLERNLNGRGTANCGRTRKI